MDIHFLIPLFASVIYTTLLIVTIVNRPTQKQQKLFAIYLVAATLWSFSDFLLRSDLFIDHKLLLFRLTIVASMWWAVQLYCFTRAFLYQPGGWGIRFGYISLLIFALLAILGFIPPSVSFEGGVISPTYNWWIIVYGVPLLTLATMGLYSLIKKFRSLTDAEERNKIGYFVTAICMLAIFGFSGMTHLAREFPVSHLGGLFSAIILTYAVLKHELVSINLILRRSLGWISLTVTCIVSYLILLFLIHLLIGFDLRIITWILVTLAALIIAMLLHWLRPIFLGKIDQIFYRERYEHRRELLDFARDKIGGVYSLQELSEGLLPPLIKVLDCQQGYMLLQKANAGDFVAEFSEPYNQDAHIFRIRQNSPIIDWLRKENLTKAGIDVLPVFRGLWEHERDVVRNLGIEMLFPLISRGNLIGILALGRKKSGRYSVEDTNLVETIASQVAISLEKEYLQDELRKREQELSLINRLAGVITSSLNIQEVYDAFVAGLREVVDVDFATVALIEGNEIYFSALSTSTKVGAVWQVGQRLPLKETATEWTVTHKKSLVEHDLSHDRIFFTGDEYLKHGIRSITYLPLMTKGTGIGSLIIASRHPNAYTQEQILLLERLASQISTSIANAQLYAKAEQRARVDELTGLYNRRHFDESVKREIERHSRYGSMFSLIFLDLDNFKHYNDLMGHPAGDKLLTLIGQLLKGTLRNIDLAFRYGGDEFAIIMPQTSGDDAYAASERVRKMITSEMNDQQINITSSLGLASWPSDGLTADDIINAADKALYHAKRTGGNRTCAVSQMLSPLNELEETTPDTEKETLNTIYALAATIEARDPYTYGHSRKVRSYAVALAESIGLPAEKVAIISHAALLHDIGKIGILDEVLNKAGKLDIDELELIKTHPQLSRTIVGHVPSLTPCLPAILHHHENWDGTGYPAKLKSEAIPLEARVLTIADAFDAMTSLRPYRAPLSYKEAVEELKRFSGTQFDPSLVKKFLPIALTTTVEEIGIGQKPRGR
ncbi:diguanylate cyclase [Chloroflexota bacterium]